MKRKNQVNIYFAISLIIAFAVWTALLLFVDVQAIGPRGSAVGFATINDFVHKLTGVHMPLYTVTDWLGLVPIAVAMCFAVFGLIQWIKRKNLLKVDHSILALGIFYIAVIAVYIFFESVVINRRPVLIDGYLEASYPSSTTLLVLSVMPTLAFQASRRCKNRTLRRLAAGFSLLFSAFMVIGRLISGVHWATDIIGSVLLSAGLFLLYGVAVAAFDRKK